MAEAVFCASAGNLYILIQRGLVDVPASWLTHFMLLHSIYYLGAYRVDYVEQRHQQEEYKVETIEKIMARHLGNRNRQAPGSRVQCRE